MQVGKIYHGFRLIEETQIEEISSLARLFEHKKTKARLIHLENDDENRMFLIGFRTPPDDDTGIPHIIEHSVFCGSRKFPCKEPFVELLKGSLHTFINAMTSADVTIYPVATKNEKDFFNLMDVYLDAVFYPAIYKRKEIFQQEAWHYHIESIDDEIIFKGVVYNEMKGAYSSPEAIIGDLSTRALFPDTTYGLDSGGSPDKIPELSYKQFLDFHKKHYHPSNSYMILYGQGNLQDRLKFIHEQYLDEFSYKEIDSAIHYQAPFKRVKEVTEYYPILTDEETENKTYFCYSMVVETHENPLTNLGLSILLNILVDSEAAPLRQAILNAGLGTDVYSCSETHKQHVWGLVVKNSNANQKDSITKIIKDTLSRLVETGIDPKQIEAAINEVEFSLREANYGGLSKGLIYSFPIMQNWLYDSDPFANLRFNPLLDELKKKSKKDYFENLIKTALLDNKHTSIITLLPRRGMETDREEELRKYLAEYKKSLSQSELEELVAETQNLINVQMQPDSKESLETIPVLTLEDVNKKAEIIPQEIEKSEKVTYLYHPIFTSGIIYQSILFDVRSIAPEDIPYLELLSSVLGKVSTRNFSYTELDSEIGIHLGGLSVDLSCISSSDEIFPKIRISSKALYAKTAKMRELTEEIIHTSKFDDKQRITEIIQRIKSGMEMAIISSGLGIVRIMSYISEQGRYQELISGISYYKFIKDLENNIDSRFPELVDKLVDLQKKVFNTNNLVFSITAEREQHDVIRNEMNKFTATLSNENQSMVSPALPAPEITKEGFYTPVQTQFVSKGGNFRNHGIEYSGSMSVLTSILNLDYFWSNVRVKGGAYGCYSGITRQGTVIFSSYRDPNLSKSLNVFDASGEFVRDFTADEREMRKIIIGTISRYDKVLTPSMKGGLMTVRYMLGITQEDIQKVRNEVLSTKVSDINNLGEMLDLVMQENKICVFGNESAIKSEKDIFDRIVNGV